MARKSRTKVFYDESIIDERLLYKAGLYLRLSVEDGDDMEQNSIGNQKKIGLHFLEEHSDITLVDIYTDYGCSGMDFERTDFIRMKNDLDSGRINCIIVKDISRLGRNFIITSEYVERIFPELGIRLICINDNYDSIDEKADSSALTMPLKMIMNDLYAKDTSKKIRSSISTKMQTGEYLPSASSIPYGYIRNTEKITFDIDAEAAAVVLDIYKMRAEGMMFNAIAKCLNENGVPCPGRLRFIRKLTQNPVYENAVWIRGTIRKITNDSVYIGNRIHGRVKRDRLGAEKLRRPAKEWQIIENAHEAIIPRSLFDAVQQVNNAELEKRSKFEKKADVSVDYRSILYGKLFCADCGSKMLAIKGCGRPNAKTPSWVSFDCNNYKYSNHTVCSSHYIRQETIMQALTDLLDKQFAVSVDVERLVSDVQAMPNVISHQASIRDCLKSTTQKRKNLEAKKERLLVDLTERLVERDEYDVMERKYTAQIEILAEEERRIAQKLQELNKALNTTESWLSTIKEYHRLPVISRELVDVLIEKIIIYDGKTVKIELAFSDPFEPIMKYLSEVEVIANVG